MKSKELRVFLNNLSNLNNSFSHYSFIWNQFTIDYEKCIQDNPAKLTSDLFQFNPSSKKHNIELQKLEEEHQKTYRTLIEGIFILTYTYYEDYLKSLLEFSRAIDPNIKKFEEKVDSLKMENDSTLLEQFINRTEINLENLNDEISTLDFLRLKRNRIIHSSSMNISKSLNEIIKSKGTELNNFWDEKLKSGRQIIDFSSKSQINEIEFNFIIDIINIFRKIASSIDSAIIEKLDPQIISIEICIPDFISQNEKEIKGYNEKRLKRKFKNFCKSEYSLKVDSFVMEKLKQAV